MKTIVFSTIITGICFAGLAQDVQPKADSTSQTPYENKVNLQYQKQDDMMPVSAADVPKPIKKTLKQSQYRGWEQGSIFRTTDGKVYEVQMENDKKRIYRFDGEGKVIKD
jgi:hypothetical protein